LDKDGLRIGIFPWKIISGQVEDKLDGARREKQTGEEGRENDTDDSDEQA